jgi:hypothetical protein
MKGGRGRCDAMLDDAGKTQPDRTVGTDVLD